MDYRLTAGFLVRKMGSVSKLSRFDFMPIDLNAQALQFLLRQFQNGNVVLFAGAGFSVGSRNTFKKDPPTGGELSELLANECGWQYTGESLPVAYAQARKHLGADGLNALLAGRIPQLLPQERRSFDLRTPSSRLG